MKPINDCTLKELYQYCWEQNSCESCIFDKNRKWGDVCAVSAMRNFCKRFDVKEIEIKRRGERGS